MNKLEESILTGDIETARLFYRIVKWAKIILALLVGIAYFLQWKWLPELLVSAVVLSLVVPLGFFDVFIQNHLEYNTRCIEERQLLNAREANEHLSNLYGHAKSSGCDGTDA